MSSRFGYTVELEREMEGDGVGAGKGAGDRSCSLYSESRRGAGSKCL